MVLMILPGLSEPVTRSILHTALLVLSCFPLLFVCYSFGVIVFLVSSFRINFVFSLWLHCLFLPTIESLLISYIDDFTWLPSIVSIEMYLCSYTNIIVDKE